MGRFIARLPVVITFLFKIEDAFVEDSRGIPTLFFCVSDSWSCLSADNSTAKTSVRDGPEPCRRLDEVSVFPVVTRC